MSIQLKNRRIFGIPVVAFVAIASTALMYQNCAPAPSSETGESISKNSAADDEKYNPISPDYVAPTYQGANAGNQVFENGVTVEMPVIEGTDSASTTGRIGSTYYGVNWMGVGAPAFVSGDDNPNTITCDVAGNTVAAMGGDDIVYGGAGADVINGNIGNDLLYGGQNRDFIYGGQNDDTIFGGQGQDRLEGNLGNDTVQGDDDNDTIWGNAGNDVLYGNLGNDLLMGNEDNDTLYGGKDHDLLLGGQGDDVMYGGLGHDVMAGGKGNNRSSGGEGNDLYIFNQDEGNLEIFEETAGIDMLVCNGPTASSYTQSGNDLVMTMSNGSKITIRNQYSGSIGGQSVERIANCGTPVKL